MGKWNEINMNQAGMAFFSLDLRQLDEVDFYIIYDILSALIFDPR